jgi:Tol biopolymer transport system component/DNA-binding winged helix-turn-helix (wHTH) protein
MSPREVRIYEFGEFRLNADEHLLQRGPDPVPLSPRTFALLVRLVENAGHLLDKETLIREVWTDATVEEGNLNRTISNLRKALGEKPNEARFIQTVPRVGYRFVGEVRQIETPREPAPIEEPATRVQSQRRGWMLPVSAAVLLLVLLAGVVMWQNRQSSAALKTATDGNPAPIRLTDSPEDDSHPRWTSDGRIRFFRVDADRQTKSFIMNADGGSQTQVQDFRDLKHGVWSPDGTKVVFDKPSDKTTSYLANADGSNEVALPFIRGNFDWSFDSKEIVYQKTVEATNTDIFVYTLETKQSRNITSHPGFDADPSFSPDGKQIVFVSSREGNLELYLINKDGDGLTRLTFDPSDDSHPVFSPDGTAIAFTSDRKNESADAYLLLNPGGSAIILPLTDWNSNETVEPGCWSPDGTKIAFFSDRNGKDDIYVVSAEVVRPQLLLADAKNNLGFPSYSPDGTKIVYQSELEDRTGEIRVLDVATKQTSLVLKSEMPDTSPAWSPDGQWIAFQNRSESNTEICVIKPDGAGLRNLTNNPAKDVTPAWSPDGKQIAFASNRGNPTQVFQLFLMNADGTNQQQVYSSASSASPNWSPAGEEIVFANDKEDFRTGNYEIFSIASKNGGAEKRLTFRKRYDVSPVYSPNGKHIVFVSQADGNSELYLMNRDGDEIRRLTRNSAEDLAPHWSPDGSRIIFSSNRHGKFGIYEIQILAIM